MGAAAKLGAPIGHDFCSVSMSDLLTPWETIEKRIFAAASADFVTAVYNPKSIKRFWQIMRLKEIFLQYRSPETPIGIMRNVGRDDEEKWIIALKDLQADMLDMFTVLIIGNSQTINFEGVMITPRGYYKKEDASEDKVGRKIMNKSFRTALKHIDSENMPLQNLWVALHCIHTTANFEMAKLVILSDGFVENLYQKFYSGKPPVIITDVRMVSSGIRKGLIDKLGITVKCYLDHPDTLQLSEDKKITRTQAGIRIAVKEHPEALYAFGNAPTALIELVEHIKSGHAKPIGVIGAPVGFVNVKESKWQLRYGCTDTPYAIIEGRQGGSNVAATIINSILSWAEAEDMHPGKGM